MKVSDLIEKIQLEKGIALKGLPERDAIKLIKAAFSVIAESIDECEEGTVNLRGFGSFKVRRVASKKDAENFTKRIVFRPFLKK